MKLSAEMFNQIVNALKSDHKTERDHRLEPRVGMAGEVLLLSVNESRKQPTQLVRVRDVSRSGIGLYHTRRFAKDQKFVIQLHTQNNDSIWLVCITAYCRRSETDRFIIGARIQQILTPEQVQRVGLHLFKKRQGSEMLSQSVDMARIANAILN